MSRNPRQEAEDRLGGRYIARVLEPSPPAVREPPYFADDPVATGGPHDRPVVAPVPGGDLLWGALADGDAELAAWCAPRWLAHHPRLTAPPPTLATTRDALHVVAERVLSPARAAQAGGKIGMRWTLGGFGTPFFGDDAQLRVEGAELVRAGRDGERRVALTRLSAAAALAGVALDEDRDLDVDPVASRWLGDLFGFAASVLEELRAEAAPADEPSRVQLWTEHFDIAVELGAEAAGARATYGVSPGDDAHDLPYVYVAPWAPPPEDPALWNATGFGGAELTLSELLAADDQRAAALRFLRARRTALA